MTTNKEKNVLVIAGPTGVGESSITKEIIKRYPAFTRLVTATTRQPRLNEKEGKDYYFFSKDEFKKQIQEKNILEYSYIKNRDVYYGSYKPDIDKKIKQKFKIIMNPDIVGAKFYKRNYDATTIFIMPESIEDIKKRILNRDPKIKKEELKNRLHNAQEEIDKESYFYDHIIINKQGKLEEAINQIITILIKDKYIAN